MTTTDALNPFSKKVDLAKEIRGMGFRLTSAVYIVALVQYIAVMVSSIAIAEFFLK